MIQRFFLISNGKTANKSFFSMAASWDWRITSFIRPMEKIFFVLEYSNFAAFYLQSGKKEALYDVSSRIPEQFGLYQIFAPLRSGIDHFFQKRN